MKVDKEKFESLKSEMSELYKLIILANYDLMNLTPSLGQKMIDDVGAYLSNKHPDIEVRDLRFDLPDVPSGDMKLVAELFNDAIAEKPFIVEFLVV